MPESFFNEVAGLRPATLSKKRLSLARVFSCEFCKIFKNTYFTEHLWMTASEAKAYYNQTLSGFQKGHSTTTLLSKFRDDIKRAMNTSEATLGILLDYSKAFDTIDHLTLLEKLHKLNFYVKALKLIHSYVSERQQFVQIDDKSSSVKLNNFGVPQGSILGPVLFTYI